MTNREFYKEQILDIVCEGANFAVSKTDNTICSCSDLGCENCKFDCGCTRALKQWCNAEYTEPCEFEKDELVEVSNDERDWRFRYFSHKKDGKYYCFVDGLTSGKANNICIGYWKYCRKYGTLGGLVKESEGENDL